MKKAFLPLVVLVLVVSLVLAVVGPVSAAEIEGTKNVEPADPNQYAVGDTIHYVMTVKNPDSRDSMTITINDILPDGTTQILGTDVTIANGETKHYDLYYVVKEGDVQVVGGNRVVINTLSAAGVLNDGFETPVTVEVTKSSDIIDVPVGGEAFSVSKFGILAYCLIPALFLLMCIGLITEHRHSL